jgi:hypothetical protein
MRREVYYSTGMRRIAFAVILVGCGHAPPPKPPPAEREVKATADLAGTWVTSDDLDWGYRMAIAADGAIDVVIDRNKLGRCEQKGTLEVVGPNKFRVTYAKNECNRDYTGAALELGVTSFTGDELAIVVTGFGSEERHAYRRAPAQ